MNQKQEGDRRIDGENEQRRKVSEPEVETVYLNGEYVPLSEARVPIDDRGLTFADSLYEVVHYYSGQPFRWGKHVERLSYGARDLEITMPDEAKLAAAANELVRRNGLADAYVYLQVTRGVSPRGHIAPDGLTPTVFMTARPAAPVTAEAFTKGGNVITLPDQRWERCDLKSTGLLLSTLAKREARRRGAVEAALVRHGFITEGASTNMFAIIDGTVRTHPTGPLILAGITRDAVLDLARSAGLSVREEAFTPEEFAAADEAFLTSTTMEVFPLVAIDGQKIGSGEPGPVTRQLADAFRRLVMEECPSA
jgi:D-alanine transaminase